RPLDDGAVPRKRIGRLTPSALSAGVPGLEPRLTEPESVVLPITPYPIGVPRLRTPACGLNPQPRYRRLTLPEPGPMPKITGRGRCHSRPMPRFVSPSRPLPHAAVRRLQGLGDAAAAASRTWPRPQHHGSSPDPITTEAGALTAPRICRAYSTTEVAPSAARRGFTPSGIGSGELLGFGEATLALALGVDVREDPPPCGDEHCRGEYARCADPEG